MLSCRKRPSGSFFCSAYHFPAYLLGSKSCLTVKLSTMHEADRQRSMQDSRTTSRARLQDSILRAVLRQSINKDEILGLCA